MDAKLKRKIVKFSKHKTVFVPLPQLDVQQVGCDQSGQII